MSEAPRFEPLSPASLPDGKTENNAPVNVDAILQSILGRGAERFGMVAADARGGPGLQNSAAQENTSRALVIAPSSVSYKGGPQFFRLNRVDAAGGDAVS